MSQPKTLSDAAIEAVSMVKSMPVNMPDDCDHRHVLRDMKRTAEKILFAAFQAAYDVAQQAKEISELGKPKI